MCFGIKIESERNEFLQNFSKIFKFFSHVLVDAAPIMPMMLAQEASIIEQVDEALMMPMILAQEASIIDIIGVRARSLVS